jgi:hypothetical protein
MPRLSLILASLLSACGGAVYSPPPSPSSAPLCSEPLPTAGYECQADPAGILQVTDGEGDGADVATSYCLCVQGTVCNKVKSDARRESLACVQTQ